MEIIHASYLISSPSVDKCPPADRPEYAFIGRSNVGKSSLINMLAKKKEVAKTSIDLGYPIYFLTIIGAWKLLGVVAVLVPKFPLLKEWAYAGFFFLMSGAIVSHLVVGDKASELFGPTLLVVLTIVSWYFRPADRKITPVNQNE